MAIANRLKVEYLDHNDGMRLLDEHAQKYLQISGAEFIRRWNEGYYDKEPERPEIVRLSMLIPFAA